MRVFLLALAVLLAHGASGAQPVGRATLAAIERQFDEILSRPSQEDPFDLLGNTRGVYLEGFGVVFTTELSLVVAPGLNPFRLALTPADVQRLHGRKVKKLPELKKAMQEMLAAAVAKLDGLPGDEQVAIAVTLSYFSWENRSGLPAQILMQGKKKDLIGKTAGAALAAAIRQQEF